MPVPLFYRFARALSFENPVTIYVVSVLLLLIAGRVWSSTSSLRVRRVLHGKTIVVSGGLTPLNLSLLHSLAQQGAQLVLLHKDPSSPITQQLLHLLQSADSTDTTSQNERVYAEAVDCSGSPASLGSIKAFCDRWVSSRKKSPLGDDLGNEAIDTLILADDESIWRDGFNTPDKREEYENACLRAKIALVEGLKPVIKSSNTRVINLVSPFYAASPPLSSPSASSSSSFSPMMQQHPWRRFQPWTFAASPALGSIAVFKHLTLPPNEISCLSIAPGVTRSWCIQTLIGRGSILGWVLVVLLSPLIWAFGKSTGEATTEVERGIHLDLKQLKLGDKKAVGALINAGKVVSLQRHEVSDPAFGEQLYKYELGEIRNLAKKDQ